MKIGLFLLAAVWDENAYWHYVLNEKYLRLIELSTKKDESRVRKLLVCRGRLFLQESIVWILRSSFLCESASA